METVFELVFSDMGIILFIVLAWIILGISTTLLFKQRGTTIEGWSGRLGWVGQDSRTQKFLLFFTIFILAWAAFIFWGELSTDIPYVNDYIWNLLFIGFVVIVIASLLAYAIVTLKYHTILKRRK